MITFTISYHSQERFDGECCGQTFPEGTYISVNDTPVWTYTSDGHFTSSQTEKPLFDCLLDEWKKIHVNAIHERSTEEHRLQWNIDYPGNAIAATPNSWNDYFMDLLPGLDEHEKQIKEACVNLPNDEQLAMKMIALWIEAITGHEIEIEVQYQCYPSDE
jgi:hypothetical protein